ncbi:MAG: hypothetical protein NTY38_26855, partial [Acidobacteria bacterium]|nr:hypothetical protein [Acidobacteriota bacterium]
PSKQKYGIGTGTDSVIGVFYTSSQVPGNPAEAAKEMVETMKTRGSNPLYWQIYWEDAISDRHHKRFPPSLIDRPPLELDATEKARFQAYWDRAEAYAREARSQAPKEKLALGAFANFTEEFLRRGFPKKYLDAISLEATGMRLQPERQPSVDGVHGLYFIQEWKKKYGYADLDTIMVESLFHGTAPGYLSERDQANYYVRDFLLGLAYGVKLFGMSAMVADVSNDYYRSNWGNVGLCHRAPEPSPKESYVAYSTMTSVLDQARYAGYVETGTPSVYALHFTAPDGGNIYPLWTTRGRRPVTVEFTGGASAEVIDAMYNRQPLQGTRILLGESPVYLRTAAILKAVRAGQAEFQEAPPKNAASLDALRSLDGWRPKLAREAMLEDGNPRYPRRPGEFRFAAVTDSARGAAVEVTAKATGGSTLLPMYGVLERSQPIPIAGQPSRLGLWVNGNSGWGRITFDLIDAKGERWTGVGGSEDSYGHGFINFDGWRWVEVDLPGHFRADYPWAAYGNWTPSGGDGLIDYPLAVKAIIVELRDQVVYVNDLVPVPGNSIRLRDLRAIY